MRTPWILSLLALGLLAPAPALASPVFDGEAADIWHLPEGQAPQSFTSGAAGRTTATARSGDAVQVTATDGSATFSTTSLTTEPVGSFVLRELVTPGTYTLNIDREGLRSEVLTLRLSEGQRLTGVTVTMTGGTGAIGGT